MKKIAIISISILITLLSIPIILIGFAFGLPAQYDKSFYGGMKIKYDRIRSVTGKKIIIIGGSSVAFGIRSDLMEEQLNLPVVNFGLYANLGTKYMLDVAEDHIGSEDIVIIAPEQNTQALSLFFNGEAAWYSADGCFGILNDIDFANYDDMLNSFIKFASGKFGYWKNGYKANAQSVYSVGSFNNYGDIEYSRPYNVMTNGYDPGMPISFDTNIIADEFIEYLNDYKARMAQKGATVFYSFCPINEAAVMQDATDDSKIAFYRYLNEKLNFPVLGNPQSHVLDKDWFYDSNFHLNDNGSVYYTALVTQELKAALGDYSDVSIAIPEQPKVPEPVNPTTPDDGEQGSMSRDLAEAAKVFELSGVTIETVDGSVIYKGSWTINGLTDYGKALSEIKIPDTLAGVPVTTIADGAFADNSSVTTINFGLNISFVGQGAFNGCESLTGIYISSLNPDSFHPSNTTLDGAPNCYFYVAQSVYSEYLLNYFWGYVNNRLRAY